MKVFFFFSAFVCLNLLLNAHLHSSVFCSRTEFNPERNSFHTENASFISVFRHQTRFPAVWFFQPSRIFACF